MNRTRPTETEIKRPHSPFNHGDPAQPPRKRDRYHSFIFVPSFPAPATSPDDHSRARPVASPMIDIKETVSKHSVSLDQRRWGGPRLDVNILSKFLGRLIEDDDTPIAIGKKRRAEDTDAHDTPPKRLKFGNLANGTLVKIEDGEEGRRKVPVFKHTYDIAFTLSPPQPGNRDIDATEAYRNDVDILKKTLSLCPQSSVTSDRGDITLPATVTGHCQGERLRCTLSVNLPGFEGPFLYLHVDHTQGHQGSGDRHSLDPISAAYLLKAYDCVELAFSVHLWPAVDPDHSPEHALPLKISIAVEGSLLFPEITYAPKKLNRRGYGDAWNALVKYLFPPPPLDLQNYRGETDIAFLYSILEPAPALPPTLASADVQPKALIPSLLPFQRRSVVWMLQREGKTFDEKGQVVPFVPDYRPLFWEDVKVGGQAMYLNRMRETLSLEPPPPEIEHPGGSLNEAPGLGKTVECMALILLNPDIRRNPSVKRWNADAKVHVREVHVSGYMLFILFFHSFNLSNPDRRRL